MVEHPNQSQPNHVTNQSCPPIEYASSHRDAVGQEALEVALWNDEAVLAPRLQLPRREGTLIEAAARSDYSEREEKKQLLVRFKMIRLGFPW